MGRRTSHAKHFSEHGNACAREVRRDSEPTGTSCGIGKRVVVLASLTRSLINFRLQLLQQMVAAGHEVIAFGPEIDREVVERLRKHNIRFVHVPMSRTGTNPFQDLHTLFHLWNQFRKIRPDVVLPYTMKPIIYGLLAARLANVGSRYALVTGLGHVFSGEARQISRIIIKWLSIALYRCALAGTKSVFVYNEADRDDLLNYGIVRGDTRLRTVAGSGVDLDYFSYSESSQEFPKFLLVARLLREKGIYDYVGAVRLLRRKYPRISVDIIGPFDPGPDAISNEEINTWVGEGIIVYHGETSDIRPFISDASVVVLPSYYREGVPRSLLEALATGRAIITTDAPGCRDTVVPGENGFLVPPRDAKKLSEAMEAFILDPGLAKRMGRRSREIAVGRFDVHVVNRSVLSEMNLL